MKKQIRELVFNKYDGRCAYCGCLLDKSFQVDHMVSKHYYYHIDPHNPKCVDEISNLMPACAPCNHYKRSHCLEDNFSHIGFRTFMLNFHKRLAKLPKTTIRPQTERRIRYMNTIAEKYNISPDKPFSGLFYFELVKKSEAPIS